MQALLDALQPSAPAGDACRVFHGRGGLYPGCEQWTLDFFSPVWVLTSFKPADDAELALVHTTLTHEWERLAPGQPLNWVYQCRHSSLPHVHADTRLMAGAVPEPHVVTEAGTRYAVHVLRGQNHGLFLDMAEGRRWVRQHATDNPGLKVLNLFAYTSAFSVAALQGGAASVLNVDMSHGAMGIGQHNHALNGLQAGARFLTHDIFSTWGKITRSGPYGLVIMDPPSHQKGSFVATKDYTKLMRRLTDLMAPGGHALLCLNAPELNEAFLMDQMRNLAPELVFQRRLPNPVSFADVSAERSLKVLLYRHPD